MARKDPDDGAPTAWEWRVFVTVAKHGSWSAASSELHLRDKYVTERIVRRLAGKLGLQRLVIDLGDEVELPDEYIDLVRDADEAVAAMDNLASLASRQPRRFRIRIDAYSAHLESFAGEVIGNFERNHPNVRIDVVPNFGRFRRAGGAGMLAELAQRTTDLVIAPVDSQGRKEVRAREWTAGADAGDRSGEILPVEGLWTRPSHRWALVAAVGEGNRAFLDRRTESGVSVPVSALASEMDSPGPRVLASPKGHRSRDLLDLYQSANHRFDIVTTGEEPAALVALGRYSDRVPVVPSDSYVPADWGKGWEINPPNYWPVVTTTQRQGKEEVEVVLGGRYAVFWRETSQPSELVPLLRKLAQELHLEATDLDKKINKRWYDWRWIDRSVADGAGSRRDEWPDPT